LLGRKEKGKTKGREGKKGFPPLLAFSNPSIPHQLPVV